MVDIYGKLFENPS